MRRLVERLERLIGRPLGDEEPLAVAVSGGADSLALLLLAREAFGARVRAVTVDHGLRAESAAEAAKVTAICAGLAVPHAVLRWEGRRPTVNVQAAARAARYRLMAGWCADEGIAWLLTAHHADDQAETLLMRLARGAGIGGLAGVRAMRPLAPGVMLLRPLLAARRADLAAIVDAAGLTPIDDPSNRDPRYDRTQVRGWLAHRDLDSAQLAVSAGHLAEAEVALAWTADLAWASRVDVQSARIDVDAQGLPRELQRRLVLRALRDLGGAEPRGPAVDRLLDRLAAGDGGTLGGVRVRAGRIWQFSVAPPRRSGAGVR